ncbi:MAG: hypothetical protein Q9216_004632 [Gyalolechia sp. 2 TL-2023]
MKAFTISTAVAFLASLAAAAPASSSVYQVPIIFIGAADAQFTQYFLTNGIGSGIYNPLSISMISNPGSVTCYFFGIDGSQTVVAPGATVDVGPPQTQTYGYCY